MTFSATKSRVFNRGVPPDSFLRELVDWGKTAADEIFAPNPNPVEIFTSVKQDLGPWKNNAHRRAVMLECLRVLAGFESAWNWNDGRDVTNATSVTPTTAEAGAWQVSANSMAFGKDLRDAVMRFCGTPNGNTFQFVTKANHAFALEYIARLLRHTVRHNGPVLRKEINPWLRRDAVEEFERLLSEV